MIYLYIVLVLVFSLAYAWLIAIYYRAWNRLPAFQTEQLKEGRNFISVIIPARDEADNIEKCVLSVAQQNYPTDLFEVIVVDDHSTDNTGSLVEEMGLSYVRVLKMADIPVKDGEVAYKKRAIETGVAHCRGSVIVTTDADCTHHKNWLTTFDRAFEAYGAVMLSGPVLFDSDKSIFQSFQALDFLGMIGITAASLQLGMFNLANGANLAFRKAAFEEVGGYKGIDEKASGDDMLLIYKIAQQYPKKVHFLKSGEAVVTTRPSKDLGEFVQQRLRWTSKSFSYQDSRITWILAFVYLANVLLLGSLAASVFLAGGVYFTAFVFQLVVMASADLFFLRKVAAFFQRRELMRYFLPSQLMHVIYIVVIGLLGNVVKYDWKGRKLN